MGGAETRGKEAIKLYDRLLVFVGAGIQACPVLIAKADCK
jgi:hypothetical protein